MNTVNNIIVEFLHISSEAQQVLLGLFEQANNKICDNFYLKFVDLDINLACQVKGLTPLEVFFAVTELESAEYIKIYSHRPSENINVGVRVEKIIEASQKVLLQKLTDLNQIYKETLGSQESILAFKIAADAAM